MTDYMQKIAVMLKVAEWPGVDILQSDEAIFDALKAYIASLQDVAAKADIWRLSAECNQREYGVRQNVLQEIRRELIDFGVITEPDNAISPECIGTAMRTALDYLAAARDSARMYREQLDKIEDSTERTIIDRTAELRHKIDILENQVSFHRDTVKNLEGANEGLTQALRIVLTTKVPV